MKAPLPENEAARLAALQGYQVLDTLPEDAFDDLTALASQICGTPISLVSFIDGDRQWIKSRHGLDICETSRDVAFCSHALLRPDEVLLVPNTEKDERFADNKYVTGAPHIQFYAGAPLVTSNGEALGTLCVLDQKPNDLTERQQQALRALARQVMAQLELRRSLRLVAEEMADRAKIEKALRESEERFRAFMDHSPVVAFIKDEDGRYSYINVPYLKHYGIRQDEILGKTDFELWPEVAQQRRQQDLQILAKGVTVSTVEEHRDPKGQALYWQTYKFPLRGVGQNNRAVAGVAIDITQNKRNENQLKLYQQQLEEALAKVELQSLTDGLTGLNNRSAFDQKFEEEFTRAKRYSLPLSILLMDVDRFKSFNDSFGHIAGDELLQTLARLLNATARTTDFVARYGGEEFVVILPNTAGEGALLMGERFRSAVETMPVIKRQVTISVGVATVTPHIDDGRTLLEAADQALYKAKQSGRNRVVQSPPKPNAE
jgi:diguanylate cyclase (GGDEF)-like protein/PAS domain S-box-containing protein